MVKLSGLGGNENMPRPKHYRAFWEVDKLVRLIMAMTCVENGIKWEEVDKNAIWQGYDLAFPGVRKDDKNVAWDEYWDWSPMAYGK